MAECAGATYGTPDQVEALAHRLCDELDGRGADAVRVLAGTSVRWCEFLGIEADEVDLDTFVVPIESLRRHG